MLFKRRKPLNIQKTNLDKKRAFIFTGVHLDIISMQNLLDERNIQYSIVNEYYEIDLVTSNTVLLQDCKAISYMCKYGDCYRDFDYYIVLSKGKRLTNTPTLEKNIRIINYVEKDILNLLELND